MERHKRQRDPVLLFLGVSGLIALSAYVNAFSPDTLIILLGFYVLVTASIALIGAYLFRRKRHAILLACGITLYLLIRSLGLRQPFYLLLLIASIIAIEYLWKENG